MTNQQENFTGLEIASETDKDERNSHHSQNLQCSGNPESSESPGSPGNLGSPGRPGTSESPEIKRGQPTIEYNETSDASQQDPKQGKAPDVHDPKQDPDGSQQAIKLAANTPDASQLPIKPAEMPGGSQLTTKPAKTPTSGSQLPIKPARKPVGSQRAVKPAKTHGDSQLAIKLVKTPGGPQLAIQPVKTLDGSQVTPKPVKTLGGSQQAVKPAKMPADTRPAIATFLCEADEPQPADDEFHSMPENGVESNHHSTFTQGKLLAKLSVMLLLVIIITVHENLQWCVNLVDCIIITCFSPTNIFCCIVLELVKMLF